MISAENQPEFQDNRKITNPKFINYIRKLSTPVCEKQGVEFSLGSESAFVLDPKQCDRVYIFTLLKYREIPRGEICLKIKLRDMDSKQEVYDVCTNQSPYFDPKFYWYQVYTPENYSPRLIFSSKESLVERLERSDFPIQSGDVVYNYLPKKQSIYSQYLAIERKIGSLIQQTILDSNSDLAKLVEMKTIDPSASRWKFEFYNFILPDCCCCFMSCCKPPSVFDQENQYEAIEHSE